MGGGNWSSSTFSSFSNGISSAPRSSVFKSRKINDDFDPRNIIKRESLSTVEHPHPTSIVVAFDVTGSMGGIPEAFIRTHLGDLMDTLVESEVVTDPQVCICAVGDAYSDSAPIQITHFESDNRVSRHLQDIYIEGGGGGTGSESYELAWYWFSEDSNVILDSIKEGRKGIFFTIGDEKPYPKLSRSVIERFTGRVDKSSESDVSFDSIISNISDKFEAFHIIIEQGSNFTEDVASVWKSYIGERAIRVKDYTQICDVIKGLCLMVSGASLEKAIETSKNKDAAETALAPLQDSGLLTRAVGTGTMPLTVSSNHSAKRRL